MTEEARNVILSVRPEYAFKIVSGEKTVELRRRFPESAATGGKALIYASSPTQQIIGHVVIAEVVRLEIDLLWQKYGHFACVTKEFFYSYFNGLEFGYALVLTEPVEASAPLSIRRLNDDFNVTAPQSFRYAPDSLTASVAA
jgi:predicted transcriptional regulator